MHEASGAELPAILDEAAGRGDDAETADLAHLEITGTEFFDRSKYRLKREEMPQIPASHKPQFADEMKAAGVTVTAGRIDPRKLRQTQAEVSANTAGKLLAKMRSGEFTDDHSMVVSRDNYILDGHHRWAAGVALAYERDGSEAVEMSILRIGLPINKLMEEAKAFNERNNIAARTIKSLDDDELWLKFNPNHDQLGRFATSPGGSVLSAPDKATGGGRSSGGSIHVAIRHDGKKWATADGKPLPAHASKIRIPPAWKNVVVNADPKGEPVVAGLDAKGRKQAIYSANHTAKAAAEKFHRVSELMEKRAAISKQVESHLSHDSQETRESAAVTKLIMATGIRPGSDKDTGGQRQAYGATTLEGRHVYDGKRGVRLRFVGKKGVDLSIAVDDESVAKMLLARKKSAGERGRLFSVSDSQLRDYVDGLDGGKFSPKDFRTMIGTSLAAKLVSATKKAPKTEKDYKKAVREVAKQVAEQLGNTPAIALQSYINPAVFTEWRVASDA